MSKAQQLITEHIDIWTSAILAKSGVGRGSSKKRELYGIKKLRELILELAVRGKLVAQDPTDEPASVLLERIAVEKAELIKAKKIKKPKALPKINEDEKPFELPEGWEFTRLGEISEISPRNTSVEDNTEVSFIPMPLISTAYNGVHDSEVRSWGEIKKGYTHFADGDIAIAKITPCFENSKAAIFSNLKNGVGTGTTELHVARPIGNNLLLQFILLYLKSPKFLEEGELKMTGSAGQKRVPKSYFESNPLPIPPLLEQHRIVQKVDELMLLCDQLEQQTETSIDAQTTLVEVLLSTLTNSTDADELAQNWVRIAEHFDTLFTTEQSIEALKQTILQLAVMGKLVPQNSEDEPASVLLERIISEKAELVKQGKLRKTKPLPDIHQDEEPFSLPDGWIFTRLGNIGVCVTGKTPSTSNASFFNGDIPFVGPGQITIDGDVTPPEKTLTELGLERSSEALEGDILMVCIGGSIGKSAISNRRVGFNQQINAIRPILTNHNFLLFSMLTNSFQRELISKSSGSATPIINRSKWEALPLQLPPLDEQHRIVAKVDELMAICDQLKGQLQQSQQTQVYLTDALVDNALA